MKLVVQTQGASPAFVTIDPARTLGRGATATIYEVDYLGRTCAAKIYFDRGKLPLQKIREMVSAPPTGIALQLSGREYPLVAWPTELLYQDGVAVGFLMPAIDPSHCFPLDYYFDRTLFSRLGSATEAALSYRLEIAASLSRLVAGLHAQSIHIVDFKPQNIRVLRGIHVVTLVDCDGFSVPQSGEGRFPAELMSSDYVAPEAYRDHLAPTMLGEGQDRYALAVVLFQLLNSGTHPFQGVPLTSAESPSTNDERAAAGLYPYGVVPSDAVAPNPTSLHACWPDTLRASFDQAFLAAAPEARPSASEWADLLEQLLREKALVRCDVAPGDIGHMKFKDKPCPGCVGRERGAVKSPFAPYTVPKPADPQPSPGSIQGQSDADFSFLMFWLLVMFVLAFIFILGLSTSQRQAYSAYQPAVQAASANVALPTQTVQVDPMLGEAQLGADDAPLEIVLYSSLTCPRCVQFEQYVLPKLRADYVDTGLARFILRDFPEESGANGMGVRGLGSDLASVARCGGPDRFWQIRSSLIASQSAIVDAFQQGAVSAMTLRIAGQHGVTVGQVLACLENQRLTDSILASRDSAWRDDGVIGAPTLTLDGVQVSDLEGDRLWASIDRALAASGAFKAVEDAVLQAVLPNYNTLARTSVQSDGLGGRLVSRPLLTIPTAEMVFVVVATEGEQDCHACNGTLSVYYAALETDGLKVEQSFPDFVASGSWGAVAPVEKFDFGGGRVGLVETSGYTAQGETNGALRIYAFSTDGPELVLALPTYRQDRCSEIEAKLSTPAAGELRVHYEGRFSDRSPEAAKADVRYLSDGYALNLVSGELPTWLVEDCR